MNGSVFLDTSVVVALLRGDAVVAGRIESASRVLVSSTVLGELYYGARRATRSEENLAEVEAFAAAVAVVPCDQTTSEWYGRIKHELRGKGQPIPENDLWIAAVARQYDRALVTRDEHFRGISDLTVEAW